MRPGFQLFALAALLGLFSSVHLGELAIQRTRMGRRAITRSPGPERTEVESDHVEPVSFETSSAPALDRPVAPPSLAAERALTPAPPRAEHVREIAQPADEAAPYEHALPSARAPPLAA